MKNNYKIKSFLILCLLTLSVSSKLFGSDDNFLSFHDDAVSYNGEQRDLNICLNCAGSRSQVLRDFYSNVGNSISACANNSLSNEEMQGLFDQVDMIPVAQISPFNPMKLEDQGMAAKFKSLCGSGNAESEPVAVALMNPETHEIKDIPLVLCNDRVLPLKNFLGSCQDSYSKVKTGIDLAKNRNEKLRKLFSSGMDQVGNASKINLFYQTVKLSDFVEAHYLRCSGGISKYICKKLCGSETSCTIPIESNAAASAIAQFNKAKWKVCTGQKRTSDLSSLVSILSNKYNFAFSHLSLDQEYDLDSTENSGADNDFGNFDIINKILSDFDGIFNSGSEWGEDNFDTFLLSDNYRNKIKNQMSNLCTAQETPIILGVDNKIHAVLCRSNIDNTSTLKVITTNNESCDSKYQELESMGI